jgi:hypothetical protein
VVAERARGCRLQSSEAIQLWSGSVGPRAIQATALCVSPERSTWNKSSLAVWSCWPVMHRLLDSYSPPCCRFRAVPRIPLPLLVLCAFVDVLLLAFGGVVGCYMMNYLCLYLLDSCVRAWWWFDW